MNLASPRALLKHVRFAHRIDLHRLFNSGVFPSAARFKKVKTTGSKKTALWSITSGTSFWLNSLHATRAEALCILRECTVSFILIFDLCEWHRLHVHCWFLHGSRAPHTNGLSILITNWSVCTGTSYWREPSSCNFHERHTSFIIKPF